MKRQINPEFRRELRETLALIKSRVDRLQYLLEFVYQEKPKRKKHKKPYDL